MQLHEHAAIQSNCKQNYFRKLGQRSGQVSSNYQQKWHSLPGWYCYRRLQKGATASGPENDGSTASTRLRTRRKCQRDEWDKATERISCRPTVWVRRSNCIEQVILMYKPQDIEVLPRTNPWKTLPKVGDSLSSGKSCRQ